MLLKNLMEDKQLNFDQPLLSVRRHSPTVTSQKKDRRIINSYSHQVRPHLPTYRSELKSGPISNPGAVPFLWEQSPGLPKEDMKPQTRNSHKPPIAPRLPPGRAKHQDSHDVSRNTAGCKNQAVNVSCIRESNKQDLETSCDSSFDPSNDENEGSDSGDTDEAYADALDTLSRTESSFLNCSMSGLSGFEDIDVKPFGGFLRDPQACEFMMDRFLPAAKAMASDTPHAPKKQPVQMQIQQPNKTANRYKPSLRYGPSFAKRYAYSQDNEDEEEEESDDEYDQQANLPSVCGLLPRFCLKSSLCLLSPFPAVSVRTRAPSFSANKVQPRSSSSGSCSELENESRSDRSEAKSTERILTAELDEDKARFRSESGQLESQTLPCLEQKEVLSVPIENRHVGIAGFGLHSKGLKTFQEFLEDRESPEESESDSGDGVIEKTVYVDVVQKVDAQKLRPFSPNTQETEGVSKLIVEEDAIKTSSVHMHSIVSPHEDLKKLQTVDRDDNLLPNSHKFDNSAENWGMEKSQDFNKDSTFKDNFVIESSEKQLSRAVTRDNSKQNNSEFPAPPPLPKSSSDSWLCRTLPSMTAKDSSLRPFIGPATSPGNYCSKSPASDMKWETIVKTTKVQRRHLHYSEESLTTIPET